MIELTFTSPGYRGRPLIAADVARLQAFYDANPEYFLAVNGQPPRVDEAQREFDDEPPPHLQFGGRWFTALEDGRGDMMGVATGLSDLGAARVWHLGLFVVATRLHGSGAAAATYGALEAAMVAAGAAWIRLGVVVGNTRGERFWLRQGFVELRQRQGVDTGGRLNDIRVMLKPIGSATIDDYLERVPRDLPGSTLA